MASSNEKSGGLSNIIFMLIFAVVVLMVFVASSRGDMDTSRHDDNNQVIALSSAENDNSDPVEPDYDVPSFPEPSIKNTDNHWPNAGSAKDTDDHWPNAGSAKDTDDHRPDAGSVKDTDDHWPDAGSAKDTDNRWPDAGSAINIPRQSNDKPLYNSHQQAIVPPDGKEMDLEYGGKGKNTVTAVTRRFGETFAAMKDRLSEYCQRALNAHFSHIVSNNIVDLFVKMNVNTWLNSKTDLPNAEIRNLYKRPIVKDTLGNCHQDVVYRAIFLYNLYEKAEQSFYDLIKDTTLLSNLPDRLTKSWVEVMGSTCSQTADVRASQEKVNHFIHDMNTNITLELANQMYLNHAHRMINTKPARHAFYDKRITCLLHTLLRYWQYAAVAQRHASCCQNTFNTYGETLTRSVFLVVHDALTNEELKSVHPHLWMILHHLIRRFPGIVLNGTKTDGALSLIDTMSAKIAALNTILQSGTQHYDSRPAQRNPLYYRGKEISDIFFGRLVSLSPEALAALASSLSDDRMMVRNDTLQTHITLNSAVLSFLKKHAIRLGLGKVFIWKRKAVVADNIAYYKFLDRVGTGGNQGDILYTLNTLDKPLPTLRSRLGETHGMLALFIGGIGVTVLATGKCRAFYLKSHRVIIARQTFNKMINSNVPSRPESAAHFRVGSSMRPSVNINVVSALVCDKYPVLKSTLITSLMNTYEPDLNTLDENKYLFIRANTLKVFSYAFPPSMSVLRDVSGFIDKLKTLPKAERAGFPSWSRVYAMGESLFMRACHFISDRWNAMATKNAAYIPVRGHKEKIILLWQFLKLRSLRALYTEYNLIFGSLRYCENKQLLQQSQARVSELLVPWQLVLIRLTCINFLLNHWQIKGGLNTFKKQRISTLPFLEKNIMDIFALRQEGITALFSRQNINTMTDFNQCYPVDNDNVKAFATGDLYRRFDEMLMSTDDDIAVMQVVPLYGYSQVFPMHMLYAALTDGTRVPVRLYNGSSKFSIPIRNARATCQLIDAKTQASLLKLDVLSAGALFVSLIITPVNSSADNVNEVNTADYIEYRVKVQISYRMSPLESEHKRAIVSFSTRPTTTKDNTQFYNSLIDLSSEHPNLKASPPSSALLAANRSRRQRIPLSSSSDMNYYEVPSLDELELSGGNHGTDSRRTSTAAGNGQADDTSLIPFSAGQFLQSSLSTPTRLSNQQTGDEGIYFVLNGERYALPV